jgi:hypothetical protein
MLFVEVKYGEVSFGEVPLSAGGNRVEAEIAAAGAEDAQTGHVLIETKNGSISAGEGAVDSSVDQTLQVILKATQLGDLKKGDFMQLLDLFVEKLSDE